jgi:hypothetical protein
MQRQQKKPCSQGDKPSQILFQTTLAQLNIMQMLFRERRQRKQMIQEDRYEKTQQEKIQKSH